MITIHATAEERIIDILQSHGPCSLEDVVRLLHPHLSWSDVFVAVDQMSRDGRVLNLSQNHLDVTQIDTSCMAIRS